MPKSRYKFLIYFLCVLLTGCAASGPKFVGFEPMKPNYGQVYFYRLNNFVGSANAYEILIDGEKKALLKNAGYLKLDLTPGHHLIVAQPSITSALSLHHGPINEEVVVEPGQRYFFTLIIGSRLGAPNTASATATLYVSPNALVAVPEDVAVKRMSSLGYSE
jgi:hypothetical protein